MSKNRRKTEPVGGGESAKARGADPVFDRWLERKLHELFDAVAHEPIPDDLINLIITLDAKDRNEDGGRNSS